MYRHARSAGSDQANRQSHEAEARPGLWPGWRTDEALATSAVITGASIAPPSRISHDLACAMERGSFCRIEPRDDAGGQDDPERYALTAPDQARDRADARRSDYDSRGIARLRHGYSCRHKEPPSS